MGLSADEITFLGKQIDRYVAIFIWFFGITGNILTILTLRKTKQFHSNTFSAFTIVSIQSSIFILITHLSVLILDTFVVNSYRATIQWVCKLYSYTNYLSVYVTITLLAAASIDRWLSTCRSMRLRSFSSLRNAKLVTIIVIIFFAFLLIPHPIYTEIYYDRTRNTTRCNRPHKSYQIYTNYVLVVCVHGLSGMIMIIFGYLTLRNLSAEHHIHIPGNITIKERINIQMSRTLFIQIFVFIIFIMPNWVMNVIYPALTNRIIDRSAERLAIETFLYSFTIIIYDINFAVTFYVFLFVSPTFRGKVKLLFNQRRRNYYSIKNLKPIK